MHEIKVCSDAIQLSYRLSNLFPKLKISTQYNSDSYLNSGSESNEEAKEKVEQINAWLAESTQIEVRAQAPKQIATSNGK